MKRALLVASVLIAATLLSVPAAGYTAQGYTIPDDWSRLWPSAAPDATCYDADANPYPSTGIGAADWFVFGGAGCGAWKDFDVMPGHAVKIIGFSDDCGTCTIYHINYHIYDFIDGNWAYITFIDGPDEKGETHLAEYTPQGDKLRIKAISAFRVEVHQDGPLPSADFIESLNPVDTNTPVDFSDLSSNTDGPIASWFWEFGDGATSTDQNPDHAYADSGDKNVCLTVTAWDGDTDTECRLLEVINLDPVADFTATPQPVTTNTDVTFTDLSTDSDGSITSRFWTFGDLTASAAPAPVHQYADDGLYEACLEVTDDDGATDMHCETITVLNVAPEPSWVFDPAPGTVTTVDTVAFESTSTDSDGTVVSHFWDFGDGATSTDEEPEHQFVTGGIHTVCLTVTDDDGDATTACEDMDVIPVVMEGRAAGTLVRVAGLRQLGLPYQMNLGDTRTVETESTAARSKDTYTVASSLVAGEVFSGDTWMELNHVVSHGTATDIFVNLPTGDQLFITAAEATAEATCSTGDATTRIGDIFLNGDLIHDGDGAAEPNSPVAGLPAGMTLTLNQQITGPASVLANAVRLHAFGTDVQIGHAVATLHDCPE
ncbi:MAG: PKD domain-containing protein [Thermoplasmatota archaeon]